VTDYQILLINNGLLLSPRMTREQAKAHIKSHPDFKYKAAAL
jgi:hypothetical protein